MRILKMRRIRNAAHANIKICSTNSSDNDISNFVSEQKWPRLIKCLLSDDDTVLSKFSSHVTDWRQFLHSYDVTRKLRQCSPEYRRADGFVSVIDPQGHPSPTNVFLMAVMFNARRCCQFIKRSVPDLDLAEITEFDFNAYHLLFHGLRVLSPDDTMRLNDQMEYMRFFLAEFFSSDQVARMSQKENSAGMRPIDWGVYTGFVHVVEKLMYLSHTPNSKAQVAGVMEHVQLDLSFSVSTEPSRYFTAMSIMSDLHGETNLANLKDTGLFRRPLLIAPWIDALFWRNIWLLLFYSAERLLSCCLILTYFSSDVGDYLVSECKSSSPSTASLPVGFLVTSGYSLFACTWQFLASAAGEKRKSHYRSAKGYPKMAHRGINDALRWQVPYVVSTILAIAMLCIVCAPQSACTSVGADMLRSIVGCLMLVYVMANILSLLVLSRLFVGMSKFINSFYKSFSMFANFILCYILLLIIFARLFQASGRFTWTSGNQSSSTAGNCSTSGSSQSAGQRRLAFIESFYQSFLLTLNVVDTGTFAPMPDRIDLLVTHFAFILLVPTLFINFVTGVLSSVVSDTMDNDVEALYLLKLNFSEYAETTYFWLYRMIERLRGRKSRLVISLCMPLNLGSKSMSDVKETAL